MVGGANSRKGIACIAPFIFFLANVRIKSLIEVLTSRFFRIFVFSKPI